MADKTVFFGVMVGDLFLGEENLPDDVKIDYDASRDKYIGMCTEAIIREYAALGEEVMVDSAWQNIGGSVPAGLKTRVSWSEGDYDEDEEVQFVDGIIGRVWESWDWMIEHDQTD